MDLVAYFEAARNILTLPRLRRMNDKLREALVELSPGGRRPR